MPPATQTVPTDRPRRSVLLVGSEAQPFSKTGGLADVLGALPPALQRLGWDATVVLPRYRGVTAGGSSRRFPCGRRLHAEAGFFGRQCPTGAGHSRRLSGLKKPPRPLRSTTSTNRQRPSICTWRVPRSIRRTARAAVGGYAHDWRPVSRPFICNRSTRRIRYWAGRPASSPFTTSPRGSFESDWLPRLDLDGTARGRLSEFYGRISFLKGGSRARDHHRQPAICREIRRRPRV
jgi:hypothetical protein